LALWEFFARTIVKRDSGFSLATLRSPQEKEDVLRPSGTLWNIVWQISNMVNQQMDRQTKLPTIDNWNIICLKITLRLSAKY
jgi:hypothetical protein